MKHSTLTLLLLLFANFISFGQFTWNINFDNNNNNLNNWHLRRDTVSNPGCKWQTGHPSKTVFTSAYSQPNVLVTDTMNKVPANDTSSFVLYHHRDTSLQVPFHEFAIDFWYRTDGDTTDAGTIEVSPDYGAHWINVLTEDTTYDIWWNPSKPTFRGSTGGWQHTQINMHIWASDKFGNYPVPMNKDTVMFRFTYQTNSDTVLHDGWMIDNIAVEDWWEGINELRHNDLVAIYPNPAVDMLYVAATDGMHIPAAVEIFDAIGRKVYTHAGQQQLPVDVSGLPDGTYFLHCTDKENYSVKKFTIQR